MDISARPRLLVAAHGTRSARGAGTTARLLAAIGAARPDVRVDGCFLDVATPRLAEALDDRPTVVVPLLLSSGYHVLVDIPAAVAPHPSTRAARHLGPDPLLAAALADRLAERAPGDEAGDVALVGAGSTHAVAAEELRAAATLLGARLGCAVTPFTVSDALPDELRAARPAAVATYLLAEGQFADQIAAAGAAQRPAVPVSPPLGDHPALVELVWARYDAVR
jgi:sirohydrochlorin ferrochelatase